MSQRATSQAFELLNTSAAVFDDEEGEPSSFLAPQPAPDVPPTRLFLALLLALNLYFDSSVALWQNVYKDARIRQDGPDCTAVHDWILSNKDSFGAKLWAAPGCPAGLLQSDQPDPQALFARRLAEEESVEKEDQQCSWKAVVHVPTGRLKCKPQSFTKGCALFFQAMGGLIMYYCYNYWVGGFALIKECINPMRVLKFSAVGGMFGCGAVFSFLAQDALSPGSYALYAQSGVVIVPIIWRFTFQKPIPVLTWIHIGIIALGIFAYRVSEIDLDHMFDGIGLMWVMLKVLMAGLGSVAAELLLKQDTALPFTVQVACILPSKALACLLTIWLVPGPNFEWPSELPDRPGGFFHDWTIWTYVIVLHSLGDTILSAAVAKYFDSVVKAICGVVGIIFPTWAVSYIVGWEDLNPASAAGQLKMLGGIVVIVGSFAYVLGRSQAEKLSKAVLEVEKLEGQRSRVVEMT